MVHWDVNVSVLRLTSPSLFYRLSVKCRQDVGRNEPTQKHIRSVERHKALNEGVKSEVLTTPTEHEQNSNL